MSHKSTSINSFKDNLSVDLLPNIWLLAEQPNLDFIGLISILLFLSGSFLNVIAYFSIQPFIVGLLFLFLGLAMLNIPIIGGKYERITYKLIFSVCWFSAGWTAVFDNFIGDPSNPGASDALYFFDIVRDGNFSGLNFIDTVLALGQNGGAIAVWMRVYDLFSFVGFEKGRYIGIAFNVTCVAFTAVTGLNIVKIVFPNDIARSLRFISLFSFCGIFWLFASVHIRDAMALLVVTLLVLYWVRYLDVPTFRNLYQLGLATVAAFMIFGTVRTEFIYVPVALLIAGSAAIGFFSKKRSDRIKVLLVAILMLIICGYLLFEMGPDLISTIIFRNEGYGDLSLEESGSSSLGNALIINQPFPLRLLLGSAYILVAPIPVWTGFQLESSYHIFKSFNTLFMYAITPLFALSLWRIIRVKSFRRPSIIFLLFVILGFILSISYTSLEVRHLGAFFVPLLVLALLPDLSQRTDQAAYRRLLFRFLGLIGTVHLVWAILKVTSA